MKANRCIVKKTNFIFLDLIRIFIWIFRTARSRLRVAIVIFVDGNWRLRQFEGCAKVGGRLANQCFIWNPVLPMAFCLELKRLFYGFTLYLRDFFSTFKNQVVVLVCY